MQDSPQATDIEVQSGQDAIQRLLAALGEWGVAEAQGESQPKLTQLEQQAMDAFQGVAAVA